MNNAVQRNPRFVWGAAGAVAVAWIFLLAAFVPAARSSRVPLTRQPWSLVVPNEPDGSVANLEMASSNGPVIVSIAAADTEKPQVVHLVGRPYSLRANQMYRLRFRAKASRASAIDVSLGEDHAPWNRLGLSREVSLDSQWQAFELRFQATEDEPAAVLQIGIEGKTGSLEIDEVQLVEAPAFGAAGN